MLCLRTPENPRGRREEPAEQQQVTLNDGHVPGDLTLVQRPCLEEPRFGFWSSATTIDKRQSSPKMPGSGQSSRRVSRGVCVKHCLLLCEVTGQVLVHFLPGGLFRRWVHWNSSIVSVRAGQAGTWWARRPGDPEDASAAVQSHC